MLRQLLGSPCGRRKLSDHSEVVYRASSEVGCVSRGKVVLAIVGLRQLWRRVWGIPIIELPVRVHSETNQKCPLIGAGEPVKFRVIDIVCGRKKSLNSVSLPPALKENVGGYADVKLPMKSRLNLEKSATNRKAYATSFENDTGAASSSSRPCHLGRCVLSCYSSERSNVGATHIPRCPGQPREHFGHGKFAANLRGGWSLLVKSPCEPS